MKRIVLIAALMGALLGAYPLVGVTHADSVASDAAHACQHGGYASLEGIDGTTFQNAGQCTSYVAKGGVIMGIPSCTVGTNTGCISLDNLILPYYSDSSLGTIALSGVVSFSPTDQCGYPCNGAASGGGTYTLTSGSSFNGGATSGTFTVTATHEAYYGDQTSCTSGADQDIDVAVTFTAGSQSTTEDLYLAFIGFNAQRASVDTADPDFAPSYTTLFATATAPSSSEMSLSC